MHANELLCRLARQTAIADVFTRVIRRATVTELEHFEVLVHAMNHPLVDANVVAIGAFGGVRQDLEAVTARNAQIVLRVPMKIMAAKNREGIGLLKFIWVVVGNE